MIFIYVESVMSQLTFEMMIVVFHLKNRLFNQRVITCAATFHAQHITAAPG